MSHQSRDFFADFRLLNRARVGSLKSTSGRRQRRSTFVVTGFVVAAVVSSRHVLPRDRSRSTNRNVSRLQDQFKYPRGLASGVTLVKITKPGSGASHAGEKSSLVGYKRTPCSTPLLSPSPPLFCLFSCAASWFGYDVAKSITASLLIGCLDTSRIARQNEFFPRSSLSLPPATSLLPPLGLSLSSSVARTMRRRNSSTTQHAVGVANRIVRYQGEKETE